MTIVRGSNTGLYVKTGAIITDPAPQANKNFVLSETVDGSPCEMQFVHYAGSSGIRFTVNGVNWVNTPGSHGQGIHMGADNTLPTGFTVTPNIDSPTQGGSQRDGTSVLTGTTNVTYLALAANGKRAILRYAPAFWCQPNQDLVPGVFALNKTLVSPMESTVDCTWGWNGNSNIIQVIRDVVVPDQQNRQILDCVTISIYAADSIFDVVEYVNPINAARRAYPGFPDTSNVEAIMIRSTDNTKAIAIFHPLNEYGPTGYSQQIFTAGFSNIFIRCREVYTAPTNIPPGIRRYNGFLVFVEDVLANAPATCAGIIKTLNDANITRSTDIVLPDVTYRD